MTKIRNVKPDSLFFANSVSRVLKKNADDIGCMFNELLRKVDIFGTEAFFFHANSSFLKDRHGGEITIGVEVFDFNGFFCVESEITDDSGRIVAEGPSLKIRFLGWDGIMGECDKWVREFEIFLSDNFDVLVREIKNLE